MYQITQWEIENAQQRLDERKNKHKEHKEREVNELQSRIKIKKNNTKNLQLKVDIC